jgi:hypothetical protein
VRADRQNQLLKGALLKTMSLRALWSRAGKKRSTVLRQQVLIGGHEAGGQSLHLELPKIFKGWARRVF